VIAGAQSCFPLLAAEPLPAARERVALAPPWTTSPLKTRVGVSRRRASGRLSRRRRVRSMFTPGSRACGYRTASGRAKWPSRDPLGERGGLNLYGMVGNNPLNLIDPFGLAYGNPVSGPNGPVGPSGPCCPDSCAILKAAIEAALKIMESRYWDMMYDPKDLYHTAPKGPTGPNTPYGTWEGHQQQYEGWRNRLTRVLQDFYSNKCKDPLPPGFGEWAMRPAPEKPWYVQNPGIYGPPTLPIVVVPNPVPIGIPAGAPSGGGLSTGEAVAVGVGTGSAVYIGYRCLRMIPSLLPPLWPTIPANAAIP
jgi:hypothetical protein